MRVHVHVVSATADEVECNITVTDTAGGLIAVFDGFSVQSLSASSRTSPERIDKDCSNCIGAPPIPPPRISR